MTHLKLIKKIFLLSSILVLAGCSTITANSTPTVDVIGTTAAQLASLMLTQTASAFTPTSAPPTETPLPLFTDTPTLEPTSAATAIPMISRDTPCYTGPGTQYGLVSNITVTELVEVVGISSVKGWYVIRNPIYGSLCWVPEDTLEFGAGFDVSSLPTIP